MNGPDLTGAGGRDKVRDLLTLIIDPSSRINEQFPDAPRPDHQAH